MRFLQFALLALALGRSAAHISADPALELPRFVLQKGEWICLDRNPQQFRREDCLPHAASGDAN